MSGTTRRSRLVEGGIQPEAGDEGHRSAQRSATREQLQGGVGAVGYGHDLVPGVAPPYTESGCILRGMEEKRNSEQSESRQLESLYRKATDPVLRTHLLMVWRMSLGDSVGKVAEMVGYSKKWTTEIVRRYESGGVEALGDRRHSNPGAKQRALLDEAGEAELLEALQGPPPGGGMWSGPKVARWIAQRNALEKVHVQRGFKYLRKVRYSPHSEAPKCLR